MSTDNKLPAYTWVSVPENSNPIVVAKFPRDTVLFPKSDYPHQPVARPSVFARLFACIFGGK